MRRLKYTRQSALKRLEPYFYIMPAVLVLLTITLYPLIRAVGLSFYNYNLLKPNRVYFVGLQNFKRTLTDPLVWGALKRSAIFTFVGVTVEMIVGTTLALVLNREFIGKGLVRTLLLLPMILSPVAVGLVWRLFYDADAGMVNYLFSLVGFPVRAWLGDVSTALGAVIAADVWQWSSFCFVVVLAGLEGLPVECYEAARIDGASWFQTLTYVTLPLLKPVLAVVFVLRMIDSFKMFDLVFIMTNGWPARATETMNFFVYQTGFQFFHVGRAASEAIFLTAIVTILSMFLLGSVLRMGRDTYE